MIPQLEKFYRLIEEDSRISATHISLYMALFHLWSELDFAGPVRFTRRRVMSIAKISGLATYHKCIKDLVRFGYLQYIPSHDPGVGSQAYLL